MSKIIFPRPFAIAIDDLGWINGNDDGEEGYGPYRTGLPRQMTMDDYRAVKDLAQRVGVRLQALFILGEMDRENFLGAYPTTTHMRANWDNQNNISDLQEEMMEYAKQEAAYIEFGLHGVGHEYWPEDGKRRRAEWYNTEDDHPWPEEEIINHVECFIRIMKQYGISQENGHSFPESFVPCAYSYYWNPKGKYSLGAVLGRYGVKFANTDFTQIPECDPPLEIGGGFDHKVHVMNRYNYGNLWSAPGKLPETPLEEQPTDYIETHWPNLLFNENENQEEVTAKWVKYYQAVQQSTDRYCAKNTAQMHSQWLYNRHTVVNEVSPGRVEIDNTKMPNEVYRGYFPSNMVLKIALKKGEHVQKATIDGETIPAYFEDQGFAFLYLPQLIQKKYKMDYELGSEMLSETIWHTDTSGILNLNHSEKSTKIDVCLYGTQQLNLMTTKEPERIESNNPGIKIKKWAFENGMLTIVATAHDIQGEIGSIKVEY